MVFPVGRDPGVPLGGFLLVFFQHILDIPGVHNQRPCRQLLQKKSCSVLKSGVVLGVGPLPETISLEPNWGLPDAGIPMEPEDRLLSKFESSLGGLPSIRTPCAPHSVGGDRPTPSLLSPLPPLVGPGLGGVGCGIPQLSLSFSSPDPPPYPVSRPADHHLANSHLGDCVVQSTQGIEWAEPNVRLHRGSENNQLCLLHVSEIPNTLVVFSCQL